jgi:hypothetical protein
MTRDPFDGLDPRGVAALGIVVSRRQAQLLAKRQAEVASDEWLEACRVARVNGVGIRRIAHAVGVSTSYIWAITREEASEKTNVLTPLE